jgi:hypothetical protein
MKTNQSNSVDSLTTLLAAGRAAAPGFSAPRHPPSFFLHDGERQDQVERAKCARNALLIKYIGRWPASAFDSASVANPSTAREVHNEKILQI